MPAKRPNSAVAVEVLGPFCVGVDSQRLAFRPSARRLIALLAVIGVVPRSEAAGRLWPDLAQTRAMGNLRTAVWRARRDCPHLLGEEGDSLSLRAASVDVAEVRAWAWRTVRGEDAGAVPEQAGTLRWTRPSWPRSRSQSEWSP